jgi:hypothetical protein
MITGDKNSRRKFLQHSAYVGVGLALTDPKG